MAKKHNETIHHFFSNLPMVAFFAIIIFLYTVYMTTYLAKLLSNEYDFDKTSTATPEGYATLFLTMKTITTYTDSMVSRFQTEEVALTPQEQKGAIYFVVSHVLLVLLGIAVARTIFTKPGHVTLDWSNATEAELYNVAEVEKMMLIDSWRKRRADELAQREGRGSPVRGGPNFHERSIAEEDNEETPIGQGGQGEELARSPGDIQDDPQMMEQLSQMAIMNAMQKENKRFCGHCRMFKPPRTHHCRQCNVCILKMDHHCPWVGNCVGFRNYKFFINMVFYGVVLLWFILATYTEVVKDTLFNLNVGTGLVFLIFFTYALNTILALVITGFFLFHCWLMIRGKTTLELVEEKKSGDYNHGVWKNLKKSLGSSVWLWCLPTTPHFEENGLYFESHSIKKNEFHAKINI